MSNGLKVFILAFFFLIVILPIPVQSAGSITVNLPNDGEAYQRARTRTITWSTTGSPGANVDIDLYKNSIYHSPIVSGTPNDGSYSWGLSSSLPPDVDYTVKITSSSDPLIFDYSDSPFAIGLDKLTFSGITWYVRDTNEALVGPGPNYFSCSPENIWLDPSGQLHLNITYRNGNWYMAEVYSQESYGYGQYTFMTNGRYDYMDVNAVLGLFTYLDDNNEIDIEFSRWGWETGTNLGYACQPWQTEGNVHAFHANLTGNYSTHRFDWQANEIKYQSWNGQHYSPPTPGDVIQIWNYTGPDIPTESTERVHINFWLMGGLDPADGLEMEAVVTEFNFTEGTPGSLAEELQSRWPLSNSTTPDEMRSPFGPRIQTGVGYDFHRAIDLPTPEGTPVVAIMPGQIRLAGDYPFYSQPVVQVRHEYNGTTFYANYQHLSVVHVVEDQVVEAGDVLGETGSSPSGFAHLHFGIREEGVNLRDCSHPLSFLPYTDLGPPQLEVNWQDDTLHVNVSVGNQELDFVQLDISGEGVDIHLNFVELNHATEEPDDLDNDTMLIKGVEMTIIPRTYSENQPRDYWFQFRFVNETDDLVIEVSDVLGQTTTAALSRGPEPPQNVQVKLVPMGVFSDLQLTWDASSDDGSISEYVIYRSLDPAGPYLEIANVSANGSTSYSYIDSGSGVGDINSYFYNVHTRESSGNESQKGKQVTKWVTHLNSGWNVFSVPVITASNLRTDILASIDGKYSALQGYLSGEWEHWHSSKPSQLNDLVNIDYKRGYYILMETDDYLVTCGEVNVNSQIELDKGWNLVGFPLNQPLSQVDAVNGLAGPVTVFGYDSSAGKDILLEPADLMNPTQGYWMHSSVDQTWTI
ncbi:MAG: peptidoglycan DD-metalloendopeptidase family protein [Thermoplasmata archaeon]|nr:MAG: peptidoglycan DD-metalloendopeptidase family protein [Thermoplasmata archaeon]